MRISKDQYYLGIARAVAMRSTCLRRQYGAVIVRNDEIVATGYNGAARGVKDCTQRGVCWRIANDVPHGEQYEKCLAVHAEQNAIISAARAEMIGATMYIAGFEVLGLGGSRTEIIDPRPCLICSRMILNAGIAKIINSMGEIVYGDE